MRPNSVRRVSLLVLAVAGGVTAAAWGAEFPPFTIDVVDVGTGLAVFVRGDNFALVYDGGSNDDRARGDANRLLAFIRAVTPDVKRIDHVILSHPHRDHVELLPDVLRHYEVTHVWDSGRLNDTCGYREFLAAVRDQPSTQYHSALPEGDQVFQFSARHCFGQRTPAASIRIPRTARITPGDEIALAPQVSMTVLYATAEAKGGPNENTLVVRLVLNGHPVLLMGDAEAGGRRRPDEAPMARSIEGELLDPRWAALLAADVLVVAHHGSATSSRKAFLDAVRASTFVVSSGPTRYRSVVLPDDEVVDELEQRGEVYRTDLNDSTCGQSPHKIGPEADDRPGGCDNVRLVVGPPVLVAPEPGIGHVAAAYWRGSEAIDTPPQPNTPPPAPEGGLEDMGWRELATAIAWMSAAVLCIYAWLRSQENRAQTVRREIAESIKHATSRGHHVSRAQVQALLNESIRRLHISMFPTVDEVLDEAIGITLREQFESWRQLSRDVAPEATNVAPNGFATAGRPGIATGVMVKQPLDDATNSVGNVINELQKELRLIPEPRISVSFVFAIGGAAGIVLFVLGAYGTGRMLPDALFTGSALPSTAWDEIVGMLTASGFGYVAAAITAIRNRKRLARAVPQQPSPHKPPPARKSTAETDVPVKPRRTTGQGLNRRGPLGKIKSPTPHEQGE